MSTVPAQSIMCLTGNVDVPYGLEALADEAAHRVHGSELPLPTLYHVYVTGASTREVRTV
eukprot:COSAG04_NODE_22110_length_361_cov_0.595420_1_plen_59_part_10